jgi:FkbM family methyltransferase
MDEILVPHYDPEMYEPGTTKLFHDYLKLGDSCVIAGAHQGYFTSLAASIVGPQGRVYAFEPEPNNFALLKTNTAQFDNVRLYNFALGDRETTAPFFFNSDNDGGHALWDVRLMSGHPMTIENPISFPVEIKRLDDVLEDEDVKRLKLMLFDVEGAEHSLLKGAINTIVDHKVPYIITEINNGALENCQTSQMALRSYMSLYGYKPYFINEDNLALIPANEEVNLYMAAGGTTVLAVKTNEDDIQVVFNILFNLTAK